ncbi:hypothetical protein [Actinomyces trachealis]|uniref:hypothetical protein n=1 Tax=Actinomyces trachealis TaxID=2763540 RepID=UPI001892AFCC|nr:hypothetical protein [Actinomyces trachealis]
MTGGFIRGQMFVPSLLAGVLMAFFVWSIGWTLQSRAAISYQIGADHSSFSASPPREIADNNLTTEVTELLRRNSLALLIAPEKEGLPGLTVIDPTGAIPWIDTPLEPKDHSQLMVFKDSYCAEFSTGPTHCPLTPENTQLVGTLSPGFDTDTLQYIYTPSQETPLPKGRYTLNSRDSARTRELIELLSTHGYRTGDQQAPTWLDLIFNPLIDMSALLSLGGIVAAGIYWRAALRGRVTAFQVHVLSGGTATQITKQTLSRSAWEPALGTLCGAAAALLLTSGLAQTSLPPGVLWWLALAVPLTALLLVALLGTLIHRQAVLTFKEIAHA